MLCIQLLVSAMMLLTSITSFHHHHHTNTVSAATLVQPAPAADTFTRTPPDEAVKSAALPGKSVGKPNSGAKKGEDYEVYLVRDGVNVYDMGSQLPPPFDMFTLKSNDTSVYLRMSIKDLDSNMASGAAIQASLVIKGTTAPIQGYVYCPANETVISPEVLGRVYDVHQQAPIGLDTFPAPTVVFVNGYTDKLPYCAFSKAPWKLQPEKAIFDPTTVSFEQLNIGLSAISGLATILAALPNLGRDLGFDPLMADHMYRYIVADEPQYPNADYNSKIVANVPVLLTGKISAHQLLDAALDRYSAFVGKILSDNLDKKDPGLQKFVQRRIAQLKSTDDLMVKTLSVYAVTHFHRQYLEGAEHVKPPQ